MLKVNKLLVLINSLFLFISCTASRQINCTGDINLFKEILNGVSSFSLNEITIPNTSIGKKKIVDENNKTYVLSGNTKVAIVLDSKEKLWTISIVLARNNFKIMLDSLEVSNILYLGMSKDKDFYFIVKHHNQCNKINSVLND